jgi:hypothetical protein
MAGKGSRRQRGARQALQVRSPAQVLRTAEAGAYQPVSQVPRSVQAGLTAVELDRWRSEVASWREVVATVEKRQGSLVAKLRHRGVSWDGIGWLLGTTGEAVRQRYGQTAAAKVPARRRKSLPDPAHSEASSP